MSKVNRYAVKRKTNYLGQTTHTSIQPDENGDFVKYKDYERLKSDLEMTKSQLNESIRVHRGSTVELREKIKHVLQEYEEHCIWPEPKSNNHREI